jgi:hypothetical protein
MCAPNMLVYIKKIHLFYGVNNYKYDKSSKSTTIYSTILSYKFRSERP